MPNKKHLVAFAAVSAILGSLVITTPSFAASSEQVLYSFCQTHIQGNCRDGETPVAGLIFDAAGNLYGTTYSGGYYGYGAVFELTLNNGTWAEKVLYSFNLDGKDGFNPNASLIFDAAGNLYGTTYSGGAYNEGGGTVFELIPNNGTWTEKVLHSFGYKKDGFAPKAGLILDAAGNLYGTTWQGGNWSAGTVFELSSTNGNWTETVLHNFNTKYGLYPLAGLTMDAAGNLYGTTSQGGASGYGVVFELIPSNGTWTEKVLHSFNAVYGAFPQAGVIFDTAGNLYGTTANGGPYDEGTVFELTLDNGKWTEKALHSFNGEFGNYPLAGVILDAAGNLYGTTKLGGAYGGGVVFELTPSNGKWTEKPLRSFSKGSKNGTAPEAGLLLDSAGNLYGTTSTGGAKGWGTVFEITP